MNSQTLFKSNSKVFPIISRGTTGIYVKQLQLRLQDLGAHVLADGLFDSETEAAVKTFQQQQRLVVDGIVGDQTWRELLPILQLGSIGDEVKRLQIRLNFLIGTDLEIDGIFGMMTAAAVKRFQAQFAPPVNEIVDLRTWDAMLRAVILSVDVEGYCRG
jgi:peptidoglycan hydrolase-like protein with peptidoglycan-binding domain